MIESRTNTDNMFKSGPFVADTLIGLHRSMKSFGLIRDRLRYELALVVTVVTMDLIRNRK